MSQPSIDWDADLQPDPKEEYEALLRALRRSEGFGLLFVQCTPAEGTRIIEQVMADLPTQRMAALSFDQSIVDGNLFFQVQTRLTETSADVLFIRGLEHSLLDYEDTKRSLGWTDQEIHPSSWKGVPPVMANLNQQRENFRDRLHATLVFLVSPYVVEYLIHCAPDFFDWRSGAFELSILEDGGDKVERLKRDGSRFMPPEKLTDLVCQQAREGDPAAKAAAKAIVVATAALEEGGDKVEREEHLERLRGNSYTVERDTRNGCVAVRSLEGDPLITTDPRGMARVEDSEAAWQAVADLAGRYDQVKSQAQARCDEGR